MYALFHENARTLATEVTTWRRRLHENPELAFAEYDTAAFVEKKLRDFGYVPKRIGETGLVAVLEGGRGPGKTIGLRADMDALPGEEKSGLPFASKRDGVAHSCGHDMHTAILLGAAKILRQNADSLPGRIKFLFQPAEEILKGAKTFVDAGELDDVHGLAALHVMPDLETGCIALRRGTALAASDAFAIRVTGKATHGARPHQGVDALVAAAHIVTALQTVVSRNVSPLDSAVITLGTIQGGFAPNIIPADVVMEGTLRTLLPETRDLTLARMRDIVRHTAEALGAEASLAVREGVPPLVCDDAWVDRAERAARRIIPETNIRFLPEPAMGGEDFAFMLARAPGVFWRLGVRAKNAPVTHTHSAAFVADEAAIPLGMALTAALAFDALTIP